RRGDINQPGPPAAGDVQDPRSATERRRQLGQLGKALLEEDRDVLDRDRLDRAMEARWSLLDGPAGPEELGESGIVQARDDGGDELAAEVLGMGVVEQDGFDVLVEADTVAVEHDQGRGVRP